MPEEAHVGVAVWEVQQGPVDLVDVEADVAADEDKPVVGSVEACCAPGCCHLGVLALEILSRV